LPSESFKKVLKKRKSELIKVKCELNFIYFLNKKIKNNATSFEISSIVNNPKAPINIFKDIDLQKIGYKSINDDKSRESQLFKDRLNEFIGIYQGSRDYLQTKIFELRKYINR
jgi:hypothetical protein